MFSLSIIQDTVMKVAEAITEALEIETEIIDDTLKIIGGTGRYIKKIGTYEEDGNPDSGFIYGKLLKSGEDYICTNPEEDKSYNPKEGELAEICCPIVLDGKVIGLIGLVAFTDEQYEKISKNHRKLLLFLKRMADLIASKLAETKSSNENKAILESIHDGLIAVNKDGVIASCNHRSEELLGKPRNELIGKDISVLWPGEDAAKVMETGISVKDKEEIYYSNGKEKRFLCTIVPVNQNNSFTDAGKPIGCVISFQNVSDIRRRIYHMTSSDSQTSFDDIIGSSDTITKVKNRAFHVAASDSTILITGESGTGKELFARAIHFASERRNNSFVAINCGAIPEMLLESELFGYEKGAFTGADKSGKPGKFEIADNGTVFLDEIGDMPLHLQVKLLHVLQSRQVERVGGIHPINVNVRIIAATNKNLEEMISRKEFREDLYFRLNVIPMHIPPLRERREDIGILLEYALNKFNRKLHKKILGFDDNAYKALIEYQWPGNVRELENTVEYAVNMEDGNRIRLSNLPDRVQGQAGKTEESIFNLKDRMNECQKAIIEECLSKTGYSVEQKIKAAKMLGISESTLYRRIKELGIKEKP